MIGTIDIRVQAAKPNFPLEKIRAFLNSPSSLRLRNVPREIGKWEITEVFVSANYPDNSMVSAKAVETAGIYVATLPASSVAGSSANGYTVTANGIDENGAAVEGYILGKGDLEILNADGTITVGETTYYIHIVPTKPASPHKGDFALDTKELYDGEKWISLGGSSSVEWDAILNKPNFKAVATSGSYNDLEDKPTIPDAVTEETVSGWGFLKKTWAELVAAFAAKTDIPDVVAPASDMALSGKAADAYETGVKLAGKVDTTNLQLKAILDQAILIGENLGSYGISVFNDVIGKSGLYFGQDWKLFLIPDPYSDYRIIVPTSPDFKEETLALLSDIARNEAGGLTPSAKAAFLADTAFKEAVDNEIDEHGGGGGGDIKYDPETDEIYVEFDKEA